MINRKILPALLVLICSAILSGCEFMSEDLRVNQSAYDTTTTSQTQALQTQQQTFNTEPFSDTAQAVSENASACQARPGSCGIKYDQLTQNEKNAYNQMSDGLIRHDTDIIINSDINRDSLYRIYDAILTTEEMSMYDPMRRYSCSYMEDTGQITRVTPVYRYSSEEETNIKAETEAAADKVFDMITPGMTDVDKVKVFHDYIVKNCIYYSEILKCSDEEVEKIIDQSNYDNAYGVLVEQKAVCEGYARAFRYLCQRAGIPCELISGSGCGEQHMWNIVCLDEQWYHIDVTWDDPVTNSDFSYNNISYSYFNIDDTEIKNDHIIDEAFFKYPECTSDDANYFKYYDLIASNKEEASEILKREIINLNGSSGVLYIKASDNNSYNEIISYLFSDKQNGMSQIFIDANKQLGIQETSRSFIRSTDEIKHIIKLVI